MERELLVTGIGGQGVQLASAVLAHAAVAEGRDAQLFGSYGGMMRGGATETTLVIADAPVEAPPTVTRAWAVLVMHHEHAAPALARLRAGSLAFFDPELIPALPPAEGVTTVSVPASEIARESGHAMAASMAMIAACAGATRLVGLDPLLEATRALLPAYRAQHLEVNERALRRGFASVHQPLPPAWSEPARSAS